MRPFDDDDLALAWAILKDLSDRAGIPEWLGSDSDDAAKDVAWDIATLIAARRGSPSGGSDGR